MNYATTNRSAQLLKSCYLMLCRVYHISLNFDSRDFIAEDLGDAAILFDDLFDMIIRSGFYQFQRVRR